MLDGYRTRLPMNCHSFTTWSVTLMITSVACSTAIRTNRHRKTRSQRFRHGPLLRARGPETFRSAFGGRDNWSIPYLLGHPPRGIAGGGRLPRKHLSRAEDGAVEHPIHTGGRSVWPYPGPARRRRANAVPTCAPEGAGALRLPRMAYRHPARCNIFSKRTAPIRTLAIPCQQESLLIENLFEDRPPLRTNHFARYVDQRAGISDSPVAAPTTAADLAVAIQEVHPIYHRNGPARTGNSRGSPNLTPRCGAKVRTGLACRAPAMPNGRSRMG